MSALGQKQTSETPANNVRFTPNSGHQWVGVGMSAFSQKRTFGRRLVARKWGVRKTARFRASRNNGLGSLV